MNTGDKWLFLDLEGTIIDDIETGIVLEENVARIEKFILREYPDHIITFSWAFWTPGDLQRFPMIANWFKKRFGRELKLQAFDVREQRLEFLKSVLGEVTPEELFNFNMLATKERVFEWFARNKRLVGHFILIDDTVPTKTILCNSGKLKIDLHNVYSV
ncbi:MAG: hypothetical protein WC511_02350 [Candidatus Pacearchaeota archaeon]